MTVILISLLFNYSANIILIFPLNRVPSTVSCRLATTTACHKYRYTYDKTTNKSRYVLTSTTGEAPSEFLIVTALTKNSKLLADYEMEHKLDCPLWKELDLKDEITFDDCFFPS